MPKVRRKITQSGRYSKVLNIPKTFLKALGWREKQIVEVELDERRKRLVVRDYKAQKKL